MSLPCGTCKGFVDCFKKGSAEYLDTPGCFDREDDEDEVQKYMIADEEAGWIGVENLVQEREDAAARSGRPKITITFDRAGRTR